MHKRVAEDKKKALEARKEMLISKLAYWNEKIKNIQTDQPQYIDYEDNESSDSDVSFHIDTKKAQDENEKLKSKLHVSCRATRELTKLQIIEIKDDILTSEPVAEGIDSEEFKNDPGLWREITAECRFDIVHFTINFYVYCPYRKFAARKYRNLKVCLLKKAYEDELANSGLHSVQTPADCLQILLDYSKECRSRKSSLAKLVDTFGDKLHLENGPNGGYVVKCVGRMTMSWIIHYKESPSLPLRHQFNFDMEYIEQERYGKIKATYKQLKDEKLTTDERTVLLATIINICFEDQMESQTRPH